MLMPVPANTATDLITLDKSSLSRADSSCWEILGTWQVNSHNSHQSWRGPDQIERRCFWTICYQTVISKPASSTSQRPLFFNWKTKLGISDSVYPFWPGVLVHSHLLMCWILSSEFFYFFYFLFIWSDIPSKNKETVMPYHRCVHAYSKSTRRQQINDSHQVG